ncbi:usg protein [Acuticoccus sp.]|uniref:usg protein n=1 Tax=Acuticoccus sp. TaxID=1904378 RepID=UPI003B51C169
MATAFERELAGYSLTTAEILYRLPDHPAILQSYVWQDYDVAPEFPVLESFLSFWRREIEGKLHSVNVSYRRKLAAGAWRTVQFQHVH